MKRLKIQNYLVQRDLYELVNLSSLNISISFGKDITLIARDGDNETRYPYDNKEDAIDDWVEIKRINQAIEV